jgi:hypothetical protein
MSNLTAPLGEGFDDDGFSTSSSSSGRGHDFLRWNAEDGWTDRDGCEAPSPMLVVKVDEILRSWKDNQPQDITTKPLPNPDELNAKIPLSEWDEGVDGKPRPPWAHQVVFCLVNPATATKYVYISPTVGAHIAYEQLKENVFTMRMLRGSPVIPLVEPTSKPMKTKYRMGARPDFRIVGWHLPGGHDGVLSPPTTPQLPGPTAAEVPPPTIEARPAQSSQLKPDPISSGLQPQPHLKPQSQQQKKHPIKPMPPVNATLHHMGGVKPATTAEILDDDIPW